MNDMMYIDVDIKCLDTSPAETPASSIQKRAPFFSGLPQDFGAVNARYGPSYRPVFAKLS